LGDSHGWIRYFVKNAGGSALLILVGSITHCYYHFTSNGISQEWLFFQNIAMREDPLGVFWKEVCKVCGPVMLGWSILSDVSMCAGDGLKCRIDCNSHALTIER